MAKLTDPQEMEAYTYSVAESGVLEDVGHGAASDTKRKLRYMWHELVADMGLGNVRTFEFWATLVVSLLALWLRIYAHYLSQWLLLTGSLVPVYGLTMLPHTVLMKYVSATMTAELELGVLAAGPFGVLLLFLVLVLAARWVQHAAQGFPDVASRFILAFGIGCVLNAPLILLVDILTVNFNCSSRPECEDIASDLCRCSEADAFNACTQRFRWEEGSGIVGIFLTLFVYGSVALMGLLLLYAYVLHVHMNGRLLDLHRRLQGITETFFVPLDLEITVEEVRRLCTRAQRWHGPRGAERKVMVTDYVTEDPLDPQFKEVTTHLAIYTAELDGRRQMYRHFLRTPDGALLELFGDMAAALGGRYRQLELSVLQQQQQQHNLDGDGGGGGKRQDRFFGGVK